MLRRALLVGGTAPEFLSATLLPGRGMTMLQITAFVPGRGEVALLASPALAEATMLLDTNDARAREMGAPFEVPWGGSIAGNRSANGTHVVADWHGRGLTLPYTGTIGTADGSRGGLLLPVSSTTVSNNTMPDGEEVQGTFEAGTFGGVWPSKTNATVQVLLSSRALDLRVTVLNTGTEPEPVGVGWSPHFRLPSGQREQARLKMPLGEVEEFRNGHATGRFTANPMVEPEVKTAAGSEPGSLRARAKSGRELGTAGLTETLVHLRPGFLDSGPIVELRDTAASVGLRLTAMTPLIRAIGVDAPAGEPTVTLRAQMNYDDPLSRVWGHDEDTGMVVLAPGQSVQWKVRLEIVSLSRVEMPL